MRLVRKALAAAAVASVAGLALAVGPGSWGGPGPGYGPSAMMGYGAGMTGGYGPGMMGGYGPGMMGGYGPYGSPGMMGGPGMGYAMQSALNLSDEQRKKIDAIHDELQSKTWDIMGKMRTEAAKIRELASAEAPDRAALDSSYRRLNDLRQQRFDAHLAARDQMVASLTKEQREQLKRLGPWWLSEAE